MSVSVIQSRIVVGLPVQRREPGGILSVAPAYTDTLVRFGVTPLILPLFEPSLTEDAAAPLLALCDGFLLTGSVADVHPQRYGRGDVPEGGYCDERRDALDWAILDHADSHGKPVFGICRGCQVMNVYRGGSLAWRYRDLLPDTIIEHLRSDIAADTAHTVTWAGDSWLASQMPASLQGVNSLHRQVCDRVAPSLRTAAVSEDGLIEGIEDKNSPDRFFGVQWHPELLVEKSDSAAHILFDRFVHACRVAKANPLYKF
ncbi:MAG: gamma-glutamyl-gamma-aminobutyrate hydrolase family protein [Armatimonadota bacterium]